MPPTASTTTTMRKPPASTTATTASTAQPTDPQRRTTSGRAVRQNTTRPSNYYVKPYSTYAATNNAQNATADAEMADAPPPGFFPALTFFTDAITALPREVMRQFTLMKEVEAKIHGPNEKLGELVDQVMGLPVPPRRKEVDGGPGGALLSLGTANNSVTGSASVSLINGVAPNAVENSVAGSVDGGEEGVVVDEEMGKRQQFNELRTLTTNLLKNLDEKNVVLAEANRILAQQHLRLDSVLPHIDKEISEEARLGSMTHWAYSDNRQKKQTAGAAANRRDVANTNSLAAAASAIHESDIAQARRDATRENAREKHKGRAKEQLDSDFDDKPKKTHAKVAKSKAAAASATTGLGISANGEPVKKRKVDKEKGLAAPAMERGASSKGKAAKETPRSTPNAETGKKVKAKPAPLPAKRKGLTSASPALASSPLHSSFNANETARPQSARLRQGSNATNLRHEKVAANDDRPTSAPIKSNGEKKRKAPSDGDEEATAAAATAEKKRDLKREHTDATADPDRPGIASRSQSHSHSGKAGRASATGTPRQESFGDDVPAMKRTRSTRSMPKHQDESSAEPPGPQGQDQGRPKGGHKRAISNSHLVRQLAPFNRSPDLDRHKDDMEEDLDSLDGEARRDRAVVERSPPKRRVGSRRGTLVNSPLPASELGDEGADAAVRDRGEDVVMGTQEWGPTAASSPPGSPVAPSPSPLPSPAHSPPPDSLEPSPSPAGSPAPDLEADDEAASVASPSPEPVEAPPSDPEEVEIDYDSEEGLEYDSDDPNEPKYCYCDRGSYGEMIACDNEQCPREWFHLGCTGLREAPGEEEKWYCRDCAPLFSHERPRGGRGGRGRGRGRG